jgi:hypothetical protein
VGKVKANAQQKQPENCFFPISLCDFPNVSFPPILTLCHIMEVRSNQLHFPEGNLMVVFYLCGSKKGIDKLPGYGY